MNRLVYRLTWPLRKIDDWLLQYPHPWFDRKKQP